jgi:PIN domain nuclease of toxin-antitoxin system
LTEPLLLDTCAVIYLGRGETLRPEAALAVDAAAKAGTIFVSVISAWELGQSVSRSKLALAAPPLVFFNTFVERSGASIEPLDAETLIAANFLPGRVHKDPVDRMLISLARSNGMTLLTSDREILAYGALGHVKTMKCLN